MVKPTSIATTLVVSALSTLWLTVPAQAEDMNGVKLLADACAVCHGTSGKGDGIVGKKFIPPTDLTGKYIKMKPDGDIYFTIRYGGLAVMPQYGDAIPPIDRWHIINYIRTGFPDKR